MIQGLGFKADPQGYHTVSIPLLPMKCALFDWLFFCYFFGRHIGDHLVA